MKKISFESLSELSGRDGGLSGQEVEKQIKKFGFNEIVEIAGNPLLELIKDTFKDPMIWFLLAIASIFILVGEKSDAIVLFLAIIPLMFMDAFLHWRTSASTSSLRSNLAARTTVIRSGKELNIDSKDLVPGDLLVLSPGFFLPADGIFQEIKDVQVDESVLTGEAFPIAKKGYLLNLFTLSKKGEVAVDPECLGYAGTRVLTGRGFLRVLFTGKSTSYGEIVRSASSIPHERTQLQKSITQLVKFLIYASGVFCVFLAGVRIYQGHGFLDAFLSAATLAIAAIPEEFPVVFTFFLGVGVYRLAKKKALVRRAVSVENIGRVSVICSDKTGTITIGKLKLTHVGPLGEVSENQALHAALAASNLENLDPIDLAIEEFSVKKGIIVSRPIKRFPFTENRKRETSIVTETDGKTWAYTKGSPETILEKSSLTQEERRLQLERTSKWAREGHKVLACARKLLSDLPEVEPDGDFEFLGIIAFEDPARPEIMGAMEYCRANGIRVVMITGDHPETAMAIAKDINLSAKTPMVVSAEEFPEKFQEKNLESDTDFLKKLEVVARCTPLTKLRIVNAFKKAGELVAVTGDGVNDVPALKAADIGIAMGERGSRSAKEVSSVILLDDNFSTIVNAIKEGRQLFHNLKMSFEYLLLIHIPFVVTAALIPLMGHPLLYLPVHIIWMELIIHPSALLAFQIEASSKNNSEKVKASFFSTKEIILFTILGLALAGMIYYSYLGGIQENQDVGHARAKAMAMIVMWNGALVLALSGSKSKVSVSIAILTILVTSILIQFPLFANALHVLPLHGRDWLEIIILVAIPTAFLIFIRSFGLLEKKL